MKEVRAFLVSPMPAAVLGALVSWATGGFPRPIPVAIFYLLLIYATQLLFGVAVRAFLLRTGRRSALNFAVGGMVMTGVPSIAYLGWATVQNSGSWRGAVVVVVEWSVLGILTGLTYWRLALSSIKTPVTT